MRVAIIGGGITGAALAKEFVDRGAEVELFDAGGFGRLASHVGFAWINGSTEIPEYYRLKVDSNTLWRAYQTQLSRLAFLHLDGHIEWSTNANEVLDAYGSDGQKLEGPPTSPQERLRKKVAWLADVGWGAELIPRDQIQQIEPGLSLPAAVEEAGWYPKEGWLASHVAIASMLGYARDHGAKLHAYTGVDAVRTEGGAATGVLLENGSVINADVVVVANGYSAESMMETVDLKLVSAGTKGMTAITNPIATDLKAVVHTDNLSVRPDGAGRLMIRHHEFDSVVTHGQQPGDVSNIMDDLLERTRSVIPAAVDAEVVEMRVGYRPIPADGLPVIGAVPAINGLYVALAHGAVTLAPVMAEIVASEATTGQLDDRAASFRIDRFLNRS